MIKTTMIWLVLTVFAARVHADCPIASYPRRTTLGNIKAQLDGKIADLKPKLQYSYPLVQPLEYDGPPRAMVAVNGLSASFIPAQFGFDIKIGFPRERASSIEFSLTFLGSQIDISRRGSSVWKILQFTFMCTESPQFILGNLPLYDAIPTNIPNTLKISTDIAVIDQSVTYQQGITHVFISGVQYIEVAEDTSFEGLKNKKKLEDAIVNIQRLREYSWNVELIRKFTKILRDQQNPGLYLKNPTFTVGYGNPGLNRANIQGISISQRGFLKVGTLNFELEVTTRLRIRYLSYSYLVYLKQSQKQNIYRHISGLFSGQNGDIAYYTPLKNQGVTFVGFNGFNFATTQQRINMYLFDFQMKIGKSNNQNFYAIKITPDNQTSFNMGYFGIQVLQGLECADCPYSPLIYDRFCVSKCPAGHVYQVSPSGTRVCEKCDLSKFMIPDADGRNCVCANQYYLISPTQECQRCPTDCLTCNGDRCLTCDTFPATTRRTLNPRTYRCECPTIVGLNQVSYYDDISNYFPECKRCNPRCLTCSGGEVNQCISCSLQRNRRLINGFCGCLPNFTEKQTAPGYPQCLCLPPYQLNSRKQCVLQQRYCPQDQIFANNMCLCQPGMLRSPITNLCISPCPSAQNFSQISNKCECRYGLAYNPSTQLCDNCTLIPNKTYSPDTKSCSCKPGYSQNSRGECISCPINSFYNPVSDSCICIFNFYKDNYTNSCLKCTHNGQGSSCAINTWLNGDF